MNISTKKYDEIVHYYDTVLNCDTSSFRTSNDVPTPIACITEMVAKIPDELWLRKNIKILDPCCGNGNFFAVIYNKLRESRTHKNIVEKCLYFNDTNSQRLENVKTMFLGAKNVTCEDFIASTSTQKYDLIVANPPYAKIQASGVRASKNHNLISAFITKSLEQLVPNGYLLFITPDNWMSYSARNTLITKLTQLQIVHLDIHTAKQHFKKIGSSFTWYVIKNTTAQHNITISGIWKSKLYTSSVPSQPRNYIPLLYTQQVATILSKTLDCDALPKFVIQTSSDLHHYTKKALMSRVQDAEHQFRLIHTPKQTVWCTRAHKYQAGWKVFISLTDKYHVWVDNCGMTQSIAFIQCQNRKQAELWCKWLQHPLYQFLNNICRYGNFNNIKILQHFPIPTSGDVYTDFNITPELQEFIIQHT